MNKRCDQRDAGLNSDVSFLETGPIFTTPPAFPLLVTQRHAPDFPQFLSLRGQFSLAGRPPRFPDAMHPPGLLALSRVHPVSG